MPDEPIDAIIALLESARKRKAMYLFPVDGRSAQNYVHGVRAGAWACGLVLENDTWWRAGEARTWKWDPAGPLPEMRARGLNDEEQADEILAIEVAAWELMRKELAEG